MERRPFSTARRARGAACLALFVQVSAVGPLLHQIGHDARSHTHGPADVVFEGAERSLDDRAHGHAVGHDHSYDHEPAPNHDHEHAPASDHADLEDEDADHGHVHSSGSTSSGALALGPSVPLPDDHERDHGRGSWQHLSALVGEEASVGPVLRPGDVSAANAIRPLPFIPSGSFAARVPRGPPAVG